MSAHGPSKGPRHKTQNESENSMDLDMSTMIQILLSVIAAVHVGFLLACNADYYCYVASGLNDTSDSR